MKDITPKIFITLFILDMIFIITLFIYTAYVKQSLVPISLVMVLAVVSYKFFKFCKSLKI